MKAAIIAAGLGERLRAGGHLEPKPLVCINGVPLIDYVLSGVVAAGLTEVACIVNEESCGIEDYCTQRWPQLRFAFVRRTTPSSMESLFALRPLLSKVPSPYEGEGQDEVPNDRFLLLTADSIFAPETLHGFLTAAARYADADGVLAVTDFIDDEKPLWVTLTAEARISALGSSAAGGGLVTAGFYILHSRIFAATSAARGVGCTALRQFFGHLVARGYRLYGHRVPTTIDVDRPEDIAAAEAFVRNGFV